jgi:hypothetical protein
MPRIAILPDEMKVDLSGCKPEGCWTGITAIVRPLDAEEASKWLDAFPATDAPNAGAHALVRQQLLRLEPVTMGEDDATEVPFDPKNPKHFESAFAPSRGGIAAIQAIWVALLGRTRVDGDAEKNSGGPSASDAPSGTAT